MEHQGALGITPDQKKSIITETDRGQSELVRLQWDLQAEKEKLVKILDDDHLDEQKVQEAAKSVMDKESKVKASHLGMLVRIKNLLTSDQITKLRQLRTSTLGGAGAGGAGAEAGAGDGGVGGPAAPSKPTPSTSHKQPTSRPRSKPSDPLSPTDVF